MSIQLRLAPNQIADLQRVVALGTAVLADLKTRLDSVKLPTLSPNNLRKTIGRVVSDPNDADALLRLLLSLRGIVRQSDEPVDEVIGALTVAVLARADKQPIDADQLKSALPALANLIESDCVRLAATAIELSYDYANLLQRTKVLTDVRPIFTEAADKIEGAVVSFTMRLRYSNANGEHDLSIALDEDDINALRSQCERAITKAQTARAIMINECKVAAIISGEDDNA